MSEIKPIITKPPDNPFEWDNVVRVFHDGAFGILFFMIFCFFLSKKSLEDAWKSHKVLMEELAKSNRENRETLYRIADTADVNAETMKDNAMSLKRLSKANTKVAAIMSKEINEVDRKKEIVYHLTSYKEEEEY